MLHKQTVIEPFMYEKNFALKSFKVPKHVQQICDGAFKGCVLLKNVKFNDQLETIGKQAFNDCKMIGELVLPNSILTILDGAFSECWGLEKIVFPQYISKICDETCLCCGNLKEVKLPTELVVIGEKAFSYCMALEEIEMPNRNVSLYQNAFYKCNSLKTIKNSEYIYSLHEYALADCQNLSSIDLSNVQTIKYRALAYCYSLKEVSFSNDKNINFGREIFKDTPLKYLHINENENKITFLKDYPTEFFATDTIISLDEVSKYIKGFDPSILLDKSMREAIPLLVERLKNANFVLPYSFVCQFKQKNMVKDLEKLDFRYFANENPNVKQFVLDKKDEKETLGLFNFAKSFGCFSDEQIVDKHGNITDARFGQKASTLFSHYVKDNLMSYESMCQNYETLPLNLKDNQNFLNFVSIKDETKQYANMKMILNIDNLKYGTVYKRVLENFDYIKQLRKTVDTNGKVINRSWDDAIDTFLKLNYFDGVTKETEDISEAFRKLGLFQNVFDATKEEREKAIKNNVVHHILGEELKEKTILEEIEDLKNKTGVFIKDTREKIATLYKKQFTYEMLDKYDPKNAIIGMYCSCCATITHSLYGKDIAKSTMSSDEVQNMVVRDEEGNIIAKTAMYVNKKLGYIVLNDFEINDKYKKDKTDMAGVYYGDETTQIEQDRQKIFDTFMRGLKAFIKRYDEKNPNNEIKQVNVGSGYNRLKVQCNKYKTATSLLTVPYKYSFEDAREYQYVLYKRGENTLEEDETQKNKITNKGGLSL